MHFHSVSLTSMSVSALQSIAFRQQYRGHSDVSGMFSM